MEVNKYRILLLDRDPVILKDTKVLLEDAGYEVLIDQNANSGILLALNFMPQLILIEITLLGMDGIEACIELRNRQKINKSIIVFYTSRTEHFSQIAAFNAGADDYLIKPQNPKVLLKRIKVLLKRYYADYKIEGGSIEFGDFIINREKYILYKNGEKLNLPKKEFELLSLLVSEIGKVYTRQEILSKIWGNQFESKSRTIDVHIRKLREKIGEEYITTIKGIGYKFEQK